MEISCEWSDCSLRFTDANDLPTHCRKHIADFYPMPCDAYLSQTALRHQAADADLPSATVHLYCLWKCCDFQARSTLELALHVAFHPHHSVLKATGSLYQEKHSLTACFLSSDTRNLIPDVPAPYACRWAGCAQEFKEPALYYRHMKDHISDTPRVVRPDNEPGTRHYTQCSWEGCSQQCLNRTRLTDHVRSHTGEKTIACPVCGGLYTNATKFNDHLTRQGSIETAYYQCSHCCKRLQSERLLRDHMRQHVNNVRCELCSMTCPSPAGLRKHMFFKHTAEKPFCCNFCSYRAKTLVDIRRHGETHNKKAAYSCPDPNCDYESKTYSALRRHHNRQHRAVSTPPRLYCCQVCHCVYRRGQDLTRHLMRQHFYKHPPSHKRFRYMRGEDGFMYLQLVRFESTTQPAAGTEEQQTADGQYPAWQEGDGTNETGEYTDNDGDVQGDEEAMLEEMDDEDYELDDGYEDYSPLPMYNEEALATGSQSLSDGGGVAQHQHGTLPGTGLQGMGLEPAAAACELSGSSHGSGVSMVSGNSHCSYGSAELASAPSSASAEVPRGSEQTAAGYATDERYSSAMAMLDLISSTPDVSQVADTPANSALAARGLGLLQGLAELTGQPVEDVARYFADSAGDPDPNITAGGMQTPASDAHST